MMQLPEIKQVDIATPLATYYQGRQQQQQIAQNNELRGLQMQEMKQRLASAPMQAYFKKEKELASNEEYKNFSKTELMKIDPYSDSFDEDFQNFLQKDSEVRKQFGWSDEEIVAAHSRAIKMGYGRREYVMARQLELSGMTPKEQKKKADEIKEALPGGKENDWYRYFDNISKGVDEKEDKKDKTKLAKLIDEYNALPEDSPMKDTYRAAISKESSGSKQRVTVGPDGTMTFEQGSNLNDLSPKTTGDVEGKIISAKESLARIQSIKTEFKPEYQEVGTRLKNAWTGLKAKAGVDVSGEDKEQLIGFKKYQRKAIENINLYIKEITGAQMSEKEADRLRLAQPDPGEKWYQGDDPITFKSKLDDLEKYMRATAARYEYYRSMGLSDPEIQKKINSGGGVSLDTLVANME